MNFFLLIIFGLIPSIIWLLFYLRKDTHPESNRMILKIFFYGMLATFPAALMELGFSDFLFKTFSKSFFTTVLYTFIGIALVEETLKYLVIKGKVLTNPEFDEPVDIMLYMIIAALGFAALENVLILFSPEIALKPIGVALSVTIFRFLGATFLHALCSGTVGYFLALSFFKAKKRMGLFSFGLSMAAILHGFFNYSIMKIEENSTWIILPIIILAGLALFVSLGFTKLKNLASVCKIKT